MKVHPRLLLWSLPTAKFPILALVDLVSLGERLDSGWRLEREAAECCIEESNKGNRLGVQCRKKWITLTGVAMAVGDVQVDFPHVPAHTVEGKLGFAGLLARRPQVHGTYIDMPLPPSDPGLTLTVGPVHHTADRSSKFSRILHLLAVLMRTILKASPRPLKHIEQLWASGGCWGTEECADGDGRLCMTAHGSQDSHLVSAVWLAS